MAYKRSSKTAYLKKLHYCIISYINKHNKLPDTMLSKSARQYHITKLKSDGVIRKDAYAFWTADMQRFEDLKKLEKFKNSIGDGRNIRGHGFHYKVVLPEIANWNKRRDFLVNINKKKNKKGLFFVDSKATWNGQRIIIKKYKCWLCDDSIVIYTPKGKSFFHYTARYSIQSAFIDLISVLKSIENKMGIDIKFKGKYKVTTSKQHFGKINDSLAKEYNQKKRKLYIKQDGKYWLIIDNSFNLNELECLNSKTGIPDMDDGIVPFFNSVRSNKGVTIDTLKDLIYSVTKNQKVHADNMLSHVGAVQDLGTGVNELRNTVKELMKEIKKINNSKV